MDVKFEILKQYLGTEDFEYLGSGAFATAYEYEGKVYKLTSDLDDYHMAKRLLKYGSRFPHFVKVYEAKKVSYSYYSNYYEGNRTATMMLIVTEKIVPLEKSDKFSIAEFWKNFRYAHGMFNNILTIKELKMPDYSEAIEPEIATDLIKQTEKIIKMLKKAGYVRWDNHGYNWGLDDNGMIKIFDFGCAEKKKVRKVSMKTKLHYHLETSFKGCC